MTLTYYVQQLCVKRAENSSPSKSTYINFKFLRKRNEVKAELQLIEFCASATCQAHHLEFR